MNTQVNDPLVQCLIGLSRHHGTSTTVEALVSGLPLEAGMLTPRLFARASQRIGLTSNLVKQQPSAIVGALLPAVILSETGQACLLMSWHDGRTSARVIYPELLDTSVDVVVKRSRHLAMAPPSSVSPNSNSMSAHLKKR